jgi:hypothetical protein
MRAYKFLDSDFGLKSIKERRLKQSRVADLNDPFELMPYHVTEIAIRMAFITTRDDVHKDRGLLCFSADWKDPVIWAHYSDKHRGLCLGFEIPTLNEDPKSNAGLVSYISSPLPFPLNFEEMSDSEHDAFARKAIFTKFEHWLYEKEIRVWGPLENEDNGLHFVPFGENMLLTEVIVGQKCSLSKTEIVLALGSLASEVKITKARAAYDKFEMVEDEQGP